MIHVLSKILGRKKSGNNDCGPNGNTVSNQKAKESQTIWQKATSLRQSLRHSKTKGSHKTAPEFANVNSTDKAATLSTPSAVAKPQLQFRREWGSQRNLAKERRSLATKNTANDELAAAKRSLYSRSLCMSGDWDVEGSLTNVRDDQPVTTKHPRSPRKLTKDSGYETSAQGDLDYANSISDWLSEEKALDQLGTNKSWKGGQENKESHLREHSESSKTSPDKRFEWNSHHRPLSFSHQEVAPDRAKHSTHHRQLRHSYSQREVSRHSRQASFESLANSSNDLKQQLAASVDSVGAWTSNCPAVAKSTPLLAQRRVKRLSSSSTNSLLQSEVDEANGNSMVTRRFKKGSVYDALASKSGLDFSPVVQLKTYTNRRDESGAVIQGAKPSDKLWETAAKSHSPHNSIKEPSKAPLDAHSSPPVNLYHSPPTQDNQRNGLSHSKSEDIDMSPVTSHEKYPSWPVAVTSASSGSYRSHSWTGQTDYPKEKIVYSRPKKAHQYKISTNQLQPVLERTPDSSSKKQCDTSDTGSYTRFNNCNSSSNCKQFDFEAFHTPCIPQCYEEKDYRIHSPPERDVPSTSRVDTPTRESNGFLSRYEEVLRHQAQYSVPLSWDKNRTGDKDTPFLDRLRLESAWPLAAPPPPDMELSSENGTWMGSMESSSHGRGLPKWQGSYSDLSTLSTQLSNRSSLFDSGHSTMPESGRLSPQSSCDGSASLLLEGPTRAQVVARHGCPREIVAHSARVQQPERHGSESVLYYANQEALYRSHASLTLTPPSRQDSKKSSNSFSSEDSRNRNDDTSGSSSDVSNITCISNHRKAEGETPKSRSMDETTRKLIFPETDKRQRISDPELKAIQKQAVMSFYQRMSLAESIKSDPPPPYEATSPTRPKLSTPKFSLLPNKFNNNKQWAKPQEPPGLGNSHSKSVPNLIALKSHSLDLPPSHPIFKQPYTNPTSGQLPTATNQKKRGSPLAKDEVISWDQLPNVLEKKREAIEKAASIGETKDPPDDNGNCSNATHYFKSHKSPRKVQLKEVHHSNETASIKVMTPDGVTLVQTNERKGEVKVKRRPAPPPPPKQPPKRPPPPPPPASPPPSEVVVTLNGTGEDHAEYTETLEKQLEELRIDVKSSNDTQQQQLLSTASSPQLLHHSYTSSSLSPPSSCCGDYLDNCPSSPELPLPPPPEETDVVMVSDEPLPPPPDPNDVEVQPRTLDSSTLVYPKNSYMSYRSERKLSRQGFDGKYRRSFHASASSMDLSTLSNNFPDSKGNYSPTSWEQVHNIRQHGTTVIFHSDCIPIQQPVLGNHLQKSNSQSCVLNEESPFDNGNNISNNNLIKTDQNHFSSSISMQSSENQVNHSESVPYKTTSQEVIKFDEQDQGLNLSGRHLQNGLIDTKLQPKSKFHEDVVINCEATSEDLSSLLDNGILTDDSFVDSMESDTSSMSVDHNQNSVKNNKLESTDSKIVMNGNDLNNRINSSTQTTDTPRLQRKHIKTKEELECDRLTMDFIHRYGDISLKNLLIPASNHKRMSDYMDGLLNLELEKGGHPVHRGHCIEGTPRIENGFKTDEHWSTNEKCNTLLDVNSKMKLNYCMEINDNQNVDNESELKKQKDELILSIGKKVDVLRKEQASIKEEMCQNELLGQEICSRLQKVAKPNEIEKYTLHVEEMEKIVNLLLSLSVRLAKAENLLNVSKDSNLEEKRTLEAKRDKLQEQHEDARRLKESIDRRSNQVSTFLHKYFNEDEYADYDHFIKMKTKLIVDIRELDEKINLGEEQLAALKNIARAHLWKSANS